MSLADLVSRAEVLLYDFDGPMCDLFAEYPAELVARKIESVTGRVFGMDDPLDILENCGSDILRDVEDALISAEVAAASSARPTPGAVETIRAALGVRKRVGVVSNNSSAAVAEFLRRVGLCGMVWPVVGRAYLAPERMKPHPWPLSTALSTLDVSPARAVFVGDSGTDIEAARGANVPCIAYANKPGKRATFVGPVWR